MSRWTAWQRLSNALGLSDAALPLTLDAHSRALLLMMYTSAHQAHHTTTFTVNLTAPNVLGLCIDGHSWSPLQRHEHLMLPSISLSPCPSPGWRRPCIHASQTPCVYAGHAAGELPGHAAGLGCHGAVSTARALHAGACVPRL